MSYNICIYYKLEPEEDKFFKNDYIVRRFLRRLLGRQKIGGIGRVYLNLLKSLKELNIQFSINKPFHKLEKNDIPIVLGRGKHCLKGYNQPNKIIAGIALMTHPSEWPDLCKEYPVVKYLQHSKWANEVYVKYYGNQICDTWFSGIDIEKWKPASSERKIDFLIYQKFHWDIEKKTEELLTPIISKLKENNYSFDIIKYGNYKEKDYFKKLSNTKALLFFSEHESQGFACCEAMSMNIPVLAWEQGLCLDPNRFRWNDPIIPASSVPFFSEVCGMTFKDSADFNDVLPKFINKIKIDKFQPREFIKKHLSLKKSGLRLIEIIETVYNEYY
ncbi:glycosyltransferase [Pedobacter chitinilyticus]|uniref:Glycosyltransferase family 1 protein n=1 Tax=Pedobacter chitinilyticus TaxID=2233776 RepID=A0A3S3PCK6_9SPHI|nr:glycosyltransferase [Pedobacter chitinilyticus]RWU08608.1 glycosyltransferase family 1 protein [Pedobacter chitinilyticus]